MYRTREVSVIREVDWLSGERRFPGELRLPGAACLAKVHAEIEPASEMRSETRYYISSSGLAAQAVRGHCGIQNQLHWEPDVTFKEDLSRLRNGFGARNMTVVRHFALNLVRVAADQRFLRLRRERAAWRTDYLDQILLAQIK